jgi:hypothetical protein
MAPDKITERLFAHAELCRRIAADSWSEDIAQELLRLAEDCMRVAEVAGEAPRCQIIPNTSASHGTSD